MFPREQILVVNGDQLIEDPVPQLRRIEKFLGLEHKIGKITLCFLAIRNLSVPGLNVNTVSAVDVDCLQTFLLIQNYGIGFSSNGFICLYLVLTLLVTKYLSSLSTLIVSRYIILLSLYMYIFRYHLICSKEGI